MLLSIVDMIEAILYWTFENPHLWVLLWPAPALYAWASGFRSRRLYWFNLLAGWFPPFWTLTWLLVLVPQYISNGNEELKRELDRINN
jgi:hypothetical protein